MLMHSEVLEIELRQDRQERVRRKAQKIMLKAGFSHIAYKISENKGLTKSEINVFFSAAKDINPVPENKKRLVFWALSNHVEYRYFNQFGQELRG